MASKKYAVALNNTGAAIDDPDSMLKENYACGSEQQLHRVYCNPEVEQRLDRQSQEADAGKRKALVWEIERKLAEDVANPIVLHAVGYGCRHPHLKGAVLQHNSIPRPRPPTSLAGRASPRKPERRCFLRPGGAPEPPGPLVQRVGFPLGKGPL
jgi:hypothetical protein